MTVEVFKDGRHNFPKFTRDGPKGPKRFTTTVRTVQATQGTFELQDHGAPWSIVAPNIVVAIRKEDTYRGTASFDKGTIRIARFEPMRGRMTEPLLDRERQDRPRHNRPQDGRCGHARRRRGRHGALARADLRGALEDRLPAHEGALLGPRPLHAGGDGRVPGHLPPVPRRPRAHRPLRQPRHPAERLALRRPRGLAALDARSLRGHEDALGLLWRAHDARLHDEAARRSGPSGHRAPRHRVRRGRRRRPDGVARHPRPSPRRPRRRPQSADVAAGTLPRAHRRRRDPRRRQRRAAGSDAAARSRGRADRRRRHGGSRARVRHAGEVHQPQGLRADAATPGGDLPAGLHDANRRRAPLRVQAPNG